MDTASTSAASSGPLALAWPAPVRLERRIGEALVRARRGRAQALASITVPIDPELDLSAAVLAAKRADDRFFCFEQPDRDGFVLAGLGQAALLEARGSGRFRQVAAAARELGRRSYCDDAARDPGRPAGAGPVFVGGFAFADDGGGSHDWSPLAPASLVLPEVSLARHRGEARMTVSLVVDGDESPEALLERVHRRVEELAPAAMPLIDPDPVERARVVSVAPP